MKCFRYTSISFLISVLCVMFWVGCAPKPRPVEVCIELQANQNLNLFDRQPHPATLYLYPLDQRLGFEQMSVDDLLEGQDPPGKVGERVPMVVNPGDQRTDEVLFPDRTVFVGIVVDYYRAPGSQEGNRRVVLEADCGWGQPIVVLGPQDVFLN